MALPPRLALRLSKLLIGLFLYGLATALMLRAGLGIAPWDVLAQGVMVRTGLSFGLLVILIGVAVLALWWPLRQRPGLGTVLNALLIGPSAEVGLWLLPDFGTRWQQWLVFGSGLCLLALATALYIGARFGPGPRDGLMTGLNARFGWPVWLARTCIEGSVLLTGWWLGGTVGLGTLAFALLIGPLVHRAMPWCDTALPAPAAAPA